MLDHNNKNEETEKYNKVSVDLFEETNEPDTGNKDDLEQISNDSGKKKQWKMFSNMKSKKNSKKDKKNQTVQKDKATEETTETKPAKATEEATETKPAKASGEATKTKPAKVNQEEDEMIRYLEQDPSKKLSKKKIGIIAGVVILALAAVVTVLVKNINGGESGKVYVESVGVITGLGSANGMTNRYSGEVEAQDSWSVQLDGGLSVAKCYVNVGDEVKKGDKLFSYNTDELKLNADKKQLELDTLDNEMKQLQKDINTYEADLKNASTSEKIELQTQILTAQTTIKKDEYSIKAAEEELKTLKENIKDATVKSKMDGVVKSINTSLANGSSDSEDSYDSYNNGEDSAYMKILAVGDYRVKCKINETNIWEITEGDRVIVRSRVAEDRTWHGMIENVKTDSTADETNSGDSDYYYEDGSAGESSSAYNFYIALDDSTDLMMGQHVLVEIDYGQDNEQSSLMLPSSYIHVEEDKYYVWYANSHDKLALKEIQVGNYNEELDQYEVTGGLSLDDFIACDDENLRENMTITKEDPMDSTEFYNEEDYGDGADFDGGDYEEEGVFEGDSYEEDVMDEGDFQEEEFQEDEGGSVFMR